MSLDETDNNIRVALFVGHLLTIKLKSDPTTDYSWDTADMTSGLQQLDSKTEPGRSGRLGEASFQFFIFKAVTAGELNL
jgi:predicted secreted protein